MSEGEVFPAPGDDGSALRRRSHKQRCMSAVEPSEGELQDEEHDRFLGVPLRRYHPSRSAAQIRDSFRRHSWEPGKRLQEAEAPYHELR